MAYKENGLVMEYRIGGVGSHRRGSMFHEEARFLKVMAHVLDGQCTEGGSRVHTMQHRH